MSPLSTKEVCALLNVNYQELMNLYYSLGDRIPVEKVGRNLVWSPQAVATAKRMLVDKKTKKSMKQTAEAQNYAAAVSRLRTTGLEFRTLGENLIGLYEDLRKNPPTATGFIHSLPDDNLRLITPVAVLLSPTERKRWKASLAEAALEAEADTREHAMVELRSILVRAYNLLKGDPKLDPDMWQALRQLIRPKRPLPWLTRPHDPDPPEGDGA
jgi:hypothetical protein